MSQQAPVAPDSHFVGHGKHSDGQSAPANDDAIDLGELVGPVLRERYGMALGAGVVGLILGILIGRAQGRG